MPARRPVATRRAGHGGALTVMPGSWGANQMGVADFVPSPDDDITYWLHAIALGDGGAEPTGLRVTPLGGGRPGTDIVIAAVTLFAGTADPLVLAPRRQVLVTGSATGSPRSTSAWRSGRCRLPQVRPESGPIGWGHRAPGTADGPPEPGDERRVVDLALAPDARVAFGDWTVAAADLQVGVASPDGRTRIEPLPAADVRVDVRLTADGEESAARVRFVAADGRYLPPLGHRDEVNPGIFEDIGRRPDPRRRHVRLRPGSLRDRPAARRRRGRGGEGLRPPAGAHDPAGRAGDP